jgi:hypothetical protein
VSGAAFIPFSPKNNIYIVFVCWVLLSAPCKMTTYPQTAICCAGPWFLRGAQIGLFRKEKTTKSGSKNHIREIWFLYAICYTFILNPCLSFHPRTPLHLPFFFHWGWGPWACPLESGWGYEASFMLTVSKLQGYWWVNCDLGRGIGWNWNWNFKRRHSAKISHLQKNLDKNGNESQGNILPLDFHCFFQQISGWGRVSCMQINRHSLSGQKFIIWPLEQPPRFQERSEN